MSRRIIRHARALLDLEESAEYIRQHNPRAALRFLDVAEAAFHQLAAMPGLGTPYDPSTPAFTGLRYHPISKFKNYIVFYQADEHGIRVLRVLHGARDLGGILAEELDFAEEGDEEGLPQEPDAP